MKKEILLLLVLSAMLLALAAQADEVSDQTLTLTNHHFVPQEMKVPAGQKIKLTIVNKDTSTAEFESDDLSREKVIPAQGQIYVYIGPLDPGTYDYYDDFHRLSATGKIIAQ